MIKRVCAVAGCDKDLHGKGVCRSHYMKCWHGRMAWPEYTPPEPPSKEERFWEKVQKGGPDDCWIWQASFLPNGYGQFDHTTAHRFAMIASGFDVAPDQVVDHICRTIACVNPAHLDVVSQSTNVQRGYAPNYSVARIMERSRCRTQC